VPDESFFVGASKLVGIIKWLSEFLIMNIYRFAVRVVVKGLGFGRVGSVTGLATMGVNVVSITDHTRLKELGPRPKKVRRL
jgi:ribosomal protein S11